MVSGLRWKVKRGGYSLTFFEPDPFKLGHHLYGEHQNESENPDAPGRGLDVELQGDASAKSR